MPCGLAFCSFCPLMWVRMVLAGGVPRPLLVDLVLIGTHAQATGRISSAENSRVFHLHKPVDMRSMFWKEQHDFSFPFLSFLFLRRGDGGKSKQAWTANRTKHSFVGEKGRGRGERGRDVTQHLQIRKLFPNFGYMRKTRADRIPTCRRM